ncbi:MAG: RNA polymerase sigma factor [Melioribacteraceae bacterium]|nr:RNA polymerase sigma factor [Melioribacteraceae bacterium]
MNDSELVKKAQQGDMHSFEELLHRHDKTVLNIAASFRYSEEDARDIYQEVFMRVYRGLKKFRFDSEFSTWLYRITTNVCISFHRKMKKHYADSLDREISYDGDESIRFSDTVKSDDSTDAKAVGSDLSSHINFALNKLPPQQKMAFTLKYMNGFKIREIAEMMECNEGTVKRYLFTAVNKMRNNLKYIIK